MAQNLKLKEIGMDSMEILYYERQEKRKKAYAAKIMKATRIKEKHAKRLRRELDCDPFGKILKEAI